MIRDYLLKKGKASVYETWKHILSQLEGTAYLKPSYSNVRILFYCLRRLGLIRKVATEPSSRNGFYRKHLYSVVKARVKAEQWYSPYESLYRFEKFKARVHLKKL
jgi:hypothetical protein